MDPDDGMRRRRGGLRSAKALSYLTVGAFNTVATYLLVLVLARYMPYTVAYSAVYVIGILLAYWLQCQFVFNVVPTWRTAFAFPLVYVVQYFVGLAVLSLFIELFAVDRRIAMLAAIAASLPVGFLLSHRLLGQRTQ